MRVLVTGAAGFIGSNFVRRISDRTLGGISSVVVLDKLTYAGVLSNLDLLKVIFAMVNWSLGCLAMLMLW